MLAGELRILKERVEEAVGYKPSWYPDLRWFDGSTFADLPDGRIVSVMVSPPDGSPQIWGIDIDQEQKQRSAVWLEKSHEQMTMLFS